MGNSKHHLIQREYRDVDGYWIDLKPGWRVAGDAHGIVEQSKRKAYAKLSIVIPCDCSECASLLETK